MAGQFCLRFQLPRKSQGSFTIRKSATWDRRLYFPSEGRHAVDFFALKNPTSPAGFEPAILGTKGQHATRPPKPLDEQDCREFSNSRRQLLCSAIGRDVKLKCRVSKESVCSLMFIPCISDILEEKNQQYALIVPRFYFFIFTCWLLHVSAVVCHHQGADWILLSYLKIQTEGWHIIYRVVTWPVCRIVVVPRNHDKPRQSGTQAT
jgi:hypothetical protein